MGLRIGEETGIENPQPSDTLWSIFPHTTMLKKSLAASALAAFLLTGCGVDTTGISADSTKKPRGSESASVTVTEYGDLQCPACKGAHELINKPLVEKYGDRIRFEYAHFPLQNIHRYALEAAMASECAADQGKFWEFVDTVYVKQADLGSESLRTWAGELGLDKALFERCLASGIKKKVVLADFAKGEKLGVNSTPSYFVNGQRVTIGQVGDLDAAVEAALKQAVSAPL